MKRLSFSKTTLDLGKTVKNTSISGVVTLRNLGTQLVAVDLVKSSDEKFTCTFVGTLFANFPASSTIYYDEKGLLHNSKGEYYTMGGINRFFFGTTDALGLLTIVLKSVEIVSLNDGNPFYFVGEFLNGTHYFFSSVGCKIVPASDPDITTWYCGLGNADGDIDEDIKQLRIYDVDSPDNVQLDVAFNVTGNYVLLGGKIVVRAYNGTDWIKISTGDYVQCAGGTFTIPVTLPSASFGVNTVVTIRCYDYETYGLNGSDTSNVVSTVTLLSMDATCSASVPEAI